MQFSYIINDVVCPTGMNLMDTPIGLDKQEECGVSVHLYELGRAVWNAQIRKEWSHAASLSHALGTFVGSQLAAGKHEEAEVKSQIFESEVCERYCAVRGFFITDSSLWFL